MYNTHSMLFIPSVWNANKTNYIVKLLTTIWQLVAMTLRIIIETLTGVYKMQWRI